MPVDFDVRGQQGMDFFCSGSIIISAATINLIENKCFCLHNILCIFKYKHMHVYI